MPMLSAMEDATLGADDAFLPVTTFVDDDVPDYALELDVLPDYFATDFAFDRLESAGQIMPGSVDPHFLVSRYERLFIHKNSGAQYYCVPWMGIPCVISNGQAVPPTTTFTLRLREPIISTAPSTMRNLRLVPSGGFTAHWRTQPSNVDRTALPGRSLSTLEGEQIDLTFQQIPHPEAGASLEIRDETVPNVPKIVGKLRILFLAPLSVDTFPVCAEVTSDGFRLVRLTAANTPVSRQSKPPGDVYGPITTDANTYGFAQIGITVNFDASGTTLLDDDDNEVLPVTTPLVLTSGVDGVPSGPITNISVGVNLLEKLMQKVKRLKITDQNGVKYKTKFSTAFVMLAPFDTGYNTGLSRLNLLLQADTQESSSEKRYYLSTSTSYNASVFGGCSQPLLCSYEWLLQANPKLLPQDIYRAGNLVHELCHTLGANHFFGASPTPSLGVMYNAHRWLRLYLKKEYIDDMEGMFEDKKVKPSYFFPSTKNNYCQTPTLFDRIITDGFSSAITDMLDTEIFTGGRPNSWTISDATKYSIGELIIWTSLSDLIKYKWQSDVINIMDYDEEYYGFNNNVAYIKQEPIKFNRFQWELIRKAAKMRAERTFL